MNKLFFTTLAIIDVNKEGKFTLYGECFKAYRGEGEKAGEEVRTVFKDTGRTPMEAFSNMIRTTSFPLEYSQNKVTIYTKQLAKQGLKDVMDDPIRVQKINLRQFIFICEDDPEKLLETKLEDEQFIGLFLENEMINVGESANIARLRIDDLMYQRLTGSRVYVIPIIKKIKEPLQERIQISGAAVMSNDKLAGELNDNEVIAYNFLNNTVKSGNLVVNNPEQKGKLITLEILNNKTKKTVSYKENKVTVNYIFNTKVTIMGVQGSTLLTNDDIRSDIEKNLEDSLRKDCENLFQKYKDSGVDILNTAREVEIKYPWVKTEDLLKSTEINAEVHVHIEGGQNLNDTQ